jgi:hypothetical protein
MRHGLSGSLKNGVGNEVDICGDTVRGVRRSRAGQPLHRAQRLEDRKQPGA